MQSYSKADNLFRAAWLDRIEGSNNTSRSNVVLAVSTLQRFTKAEIFADTWMPDQVMGIGYLRAAHISSGIFPKQEDAYFEAASNSLVRAISEGSKWSEFVFSVLVDKHTNMDRLKLIDESKYEQEKVQRLVDVFSAVGEYENAYIWCHFDYLQCARIGQKPLSKGASFHPVRPAIRDELLHGGMIHWFKILNQTESEAELLFSKYNKSR